MALVGRSGAGKTTCFYSIMGLVRPDAGRILMDGEDVTNLPMYRRAILGLGYLPQETSIFRGMTVEQNINCVLEMVEPDADTRTQELERLLDEFGLTRLRSSPAMALSGGERRRRELRHHRRRRVPRARPDNTFADLDARFTSERGCAPCKKGAHPPKKVSTRPHTPVRPMAATAPASGSPAG